MKLSIYWFRRDLRLTDNTALNAALNSGNPVLPIFLFDTQILNDLPQDDARLSFIHTCLKDMNERLEKAGRSLLCLNGNPLDLWKEIIEKYPVEAVYLNRDYEPYARERDAEVKALVETKGIAFHSFKDQVIFEEAEIMKGDGTPYTVYTPYKNRWLEHFQKPVVQEKVDFDNFHKASHPFPSLKALGFEEAPIKVPAFDLSVVEEYAKRRDLPAVEGTSRLGPHLRFGTVSIRQIITALNSKDAVFQSELIWREFFMQILYNFPHVVGENFRSKYDGIVWRNSEEDFQKWCEGKTGYPMVDAGMRQLNETGFMHNRVRMITAGFLCKHLLIDWRWGEAYFAKKLLDYELAANNGNWQWAAGTGCDAAPYFRIFNPITQLKKFDPTGAYTQKWIPELNTSNYPPEMVDHKFARERALEVYKSGIDSQVGG